MEEKKKMLEERGINVSAMKEDEYEEEIEGDELI